MTESGENKLLENNSLAEVFEVFDGFAKYVDDRSDRGGHIRKGVSHTFKGEGVVQRPSIGDEIIKSKDYHVETSLNPDQWAYTIRTLTLLTKLAELDEGGESFLSTQIVDNFKNSKDNPSFTQSVIDSFSTLLDKFSDKYPNLTPALYAVFVTSPGAEGTGFAMDSASTIFDHILKGEVNKDNIGEHVLGDPERFVGIHPGHYGEEVKYELWCVGQRLARAIQLESAKAAFKLVPEINSGKIKYDPDKDSIFMRPDTQQPVTDKIIQIADQKLESFRGK